MTLTSLLSRDWESIVERLGGREGLAASARGSGAFQRKRGIRSAVDLLRLVLAYSLGERGLRLTAAWAASMGLADVSNVALLGRLQRCGDWLASLVGQVLAASAPRRAEGRLIRIVDATSVARAGGGARRNNGVWRVHSAFDLPGERFGAFELSDETGGERLDRMAAERGEIRIADRAYLQPARMAKVLEAGADVIVRAGWKSARWCEADGRRLDLVAALQASRTGLLDRPVRIARGGLPVLRLVAVRKPRAARAAAIRTAQRQSRRGGNTVAPQSLVAAEWVVLVTSLDAGTFPAADVLALYRLRWRIELAFKRLKSLVGLKGPPGSDPRSARPWLLAHLLMIVLLEPLADAFEDSPRRAVAA